MEMYLMPALEVMLGRGAGFGVFGRQRRGRRSDAILFAGASCRRRHRRWRDGLAGNEDTFEHPRRLRLTVLVELSQHHLGCLRTHAIAIAADAREIRPRPA